MKNVFFSVLVLFMLAFSMLGNIEIAKADIAGIAINNVRYSPERIVLGELLLDHVDVTFDVVNSGVNPLTLSVVITPPRDASNNELNTVAIEAADYNIGTTSVTFGVSKRDNTVAGVYSGTINVRDENGVTEDIALPYTIVVENAEIILSVKEGSTELQENSEFVITGAESTSQSKQFTITNTGNVPLSDLVLTLTGDFVDSDNNQIVLKVNNINYNAPVLLNTLNPRIGATTITITAVIPLGIKIDSYKGNLNITSQTHPQINRNLRLEVRVEPEICSDGRISDETQVNNKNEGNVRIKDFDVDDDSLTIGDTISADVEVGNENDQDMEITIEAMLYDLTQSNEIIDWTEFESENIDEGEDYGFSFEMEIPLDNEEVDEGTYILYVKAYEDENENCNYDSLEIDINREDNHVIVSNFEVNPQIVSQGETTSFTVTSLNVGTKKQDDVYVEIINPELGLNLKSIKFDLDKYNKNDNDKVETFTFTFPADAVAKDYQIEARTYFKNGGKSNSGWKTLTVQAKEAGAIIPTEEETQVTTTIPTTGAGTFQPTGASIFDKLGDTKTLFIIGDIVLVILAVLFLVLIFKKR